MIEEGRLLEAKTQKGSLVTRKIRRRGSRFIFAKRTSLVSDRKLVTSLLSDGLNNSLWTFQTVCGTVKDKRRH